MSSSAEDAGEATVTAGVKVFFTGDDFATFAATVMVEFVSAVAFATAKSRTSATALVKPKILKQLVFMVNASAGCRFLRKNVRNAGS